MKEISLTLLNRVENLQDIATFDVNENVGDIIRYLRERYSVGDKPIKLYSVDDSGAMVDLDLRPETKIGSAFSDGDVICWVSGLRFGVSSLKIFAKHALLLAATNKGWTFVHENVPGSGVKKSYQSGITGRNHNVIILPSGNYDLSPPVVYILPPLPHDCVGKDGSVHLHYEDMDPAWAAARRSKLNPLQLCVWSLEKTFSLR